MNSKEENALFRKEETDKKLFVKVCLKCSKEFKSYGKQNRMCDNCKSNKLDTTD